VELYAQAPDKLGSFVDRDSIPVESGGVSLGFAFAFAVTKHSHLG